VGSESYTPIKCRVSVFLVDETAVMIVWMAYITLQQEDPWSMAFLEQLTGGEIPKNIGQAI
jgi:hypothetical protein